MASLYEIDQAILDTIDPETGEIIDLDKLSELQMERERKLEGVALWIKNLKADVAAYKAEKDAFADREKQAKGRIERLSAWLTIALEGQKMQTNRVAVSFRKSEAVRITDIEAIPEKYMVETITESPDKLMIKDDLKHGVEVPGCELELKNNIQVK